MSDSDFYIIDLSGNKVRVSYLDLHLIRRDLLLYFDENVGEPVHVLMPCNVYKQDYWKFLSIGYDKETAESVAYKNLIERGCLAFINGMTLEMLYEPASGIKTWLEREISADAILPYIEAYQPSSPVLNEGKKFLISTLNFIDQLSPADFDEYGDIADFDLVTQAKWFDENIVREYYRTMAKEWG
ncbi:hypothetical protein [Cohaesibacter gelatinilyticus]|uniref:Uncharacterized protein n=1 Tax=Cohaesibacter gelatinilyticus TaxID=372072 RepID=A0A285PE22_9HYPH|nr:hypothetical protein [Cohaesibacter gelatinilyticus]SNZ19457.1 hypothetical protein SAMN06265368_2544 [Cohaesibacter gelatinilyticus]